MEIATIIGAYLVVGIITGGVAVASDGNNYHTAAKILGVIFLWPLAMLATASYQLGMFFRTYVRRKPRTDK